MFENLGSIDLEKIAQIDVWGVHDLGTTMPLPGGRQVHIRYTGSATSGYDNRGLVRMSHHILGGHEIYSVPSPQSCIY